MTVIVNRRGLYFSGIKRIQWFHFIVNAISIIIIIIINSIIAVVLPLLFLLLWFFCFYYYHNHYVNLKLLKLLYFWSYRCCVYSCGRCCCYILLNQTATGFVINSKIYRKSKASWNRQHVNNTGRIVIWNQRIRQSSTVFHAFRSLGPPFRLQHCILNSLGPFQWSE
jgi:hypothetical protein